MIKFKNLIIGALVLVSFFSCDDAIQTCIDDVSGNYTGTDCDDMAVSIEVGSSSENADDVVVNIIGRFGITGAVSEDCKITIAERTITFDDGYGGEVDIDISGVGTYSDNSLTLTITQVSELIEFDGTCTFTAAK